jgi:hypothetical protein
MGFAHGAHLFRLIVVALSVGFRSNRSATAVMGRAGSLYRALLRAHRHHLPPDMRQLGDTYVRAEFQRHRSAKDAKYISGFFAEWER